jgi:dihydrodipicolinate synthase/N-acetylneuraminate lyase
MSTIKGIIAVLPTPFTPDEEDIDVVGLRRLVETAIKDGADALGLFGAGGEFYKLSEGEKKLILDTVLETVAGRLPILATVTAHATCLAGREAREYERMGVDVINIFPPHFASPSEESISNHMLHVADMVATPIMIQHAPQLTGMETADEVYQHICKETDRELYIKVESDPTGPAIKRLVDATDGKYHIVVGNAGIQMYEAFIRTACAVMPGAATIKAYSKMYRAFACGDEAEAFRLHNELLPYIYVLGTEIERFVVMEKMILERRGVLRNHVTRRPNVVLDEATVQLLFKQYERINQIFHIQYDV